MIPTRWVMKLRGGAVRVAPYDESNGWRAPEINSDPISLDIAG